MNFTWFVETPSACVCSLNRWAIASALASCLMLCGSTFAETLINSFDNFTLGGAYEAWLDSNV